MIGLMAPDIPNVVSRSQPLAPLSQVEGVGAGSMRLISGPTLESDYTRRIHCASKHDPL